MRKWIVRLLIVAGLAAIAFAADRMLLAKDPLPVRVVRVERGRVESTVTNSKAGTVKARRRAMLSPELGGRVVEIRCHKGDHVHEGDVLVQLDDETYRAQLRLAERGLEATEALHARSCISSERAKRELERHQELAKNAIVSEDLIDGLESSYELAVASCTASQADVEQAKASVDVAATEIRKLVLRAPFDGVVAELTVDIGEWITPSPPIMSVPGVIDLIDPSSLYVSAPMDEVDSGRIAVGQPVKVTLDPFPGRQFAARVVRIAPYVLDVEAQNRTVEIEVELDDAELSQKLLPGTSADVEVVLDARDGVLRIPTATLIEGGKVLVVEDGVLAERKVETGLRNWDWIEVVSGLGEGDSVVRSLDKADIQAGAKVTVESEAGAP